jgi:SpoVK/Ycf46/Vps4 family AAA+-type ATPase
LTPEQRLLCPPRVFGFAVRQKIWVQMLVDGVGDISTKEHQAVWDKLELDKKSKEYLKSLVTEHAKPNQTVDDLIPGKGNGLVVLLHGPPGVGKTLTAESLALLANKPLYTVSMSDLGTTPVTVEQNFNRIFGLATHWKALLLFDEADVFLQARTLDDLRRNTLVSVLIRILEYFQGILFLTSNRVKIFDEAFQSRIHIAIQYKELQEPQRIKIWKMWMQRNKEEIEDWDKIMAEIEDGDIGKTELNGRQIRNAFRSAMTLTKAEGEDKKLTFQHLENVVRRTRDFQSYMLQNEELAKKQGYR